MSANPIAYTYMADTHCPPCALAEFGPEPGRSWPRDDARDAEGNPVGAIFPWDEWHEVGLNGAFTLSCGTCHGVIESCTHGPVHGESEQGAAGDECTCDSCKAPLAIPSGTGPMSLPGGAL